MAEDANARIRVDIDTAAALANIKNLQRQISAFHTSMAKGGAAAAATSLNMQQGLLNSINQTGKFSATIRNVKSTTDSFTDSLQKNKLSMGEYFRYAGASTKTFGRFFRTEFDTINKVARERVKDLQTQYIKMGRDANGAMRAIAVRPLALDMENLATKTQIAAQRQALLNQLLKQGSTNLLNFGKNTQWAGRQLMVGFTVPLVMLGSVAAKTFMDMERQAVRFKRVYGELFTTGEETNKALAEIKELANEFTRYGIAVAKTMELAADIAATGKMGAELTAQVAETTRLAVLGGVEQAEALQATISLTDAFGVSAENLAETIDFLNAVENQTITSIEDLTIAIPKAGPVVRQLGGDVEDLTFFLTAMREGGINASEGANALKSGLASLINPTRQASEMLQGFGININGIVEGNAGDVKGLVVDFATALDGLDPLNRARAIEQLFGKFQFSRLSTLFQNVIKEGNQASRVLALTNASTAELAILSEREMKRIEDSPMFKFQKAIEDIKVTLVPLGEAFLKAVTPILEFGTSILKKFDELDEGAKGFVVGLTAIAGVIGPVFLMGFGLVANGVANVIKMFAFFKASLNKAGTASTQLGMQTDYMTQQQLEAAAVAASLDQIHQKLRQTFTSETAAVNALTAAYSRSIAAQGAMTGGAIGRTRPGMKLASGIISVPGPRGAGDVVPAMLSPGEAVIPAEQSKKYRGIISSLIADNVPGFRFGRNPFASMLGRSKVAVRMRDSDFSSELAASGKNARYKSAFDTQTGADYIRPSGSVNERQKELHHEIYNIQKKLCRNILHNMST
jgi:TP901 family phage tail tape measure protein